MSDTGANLSLPLKNLLQGLAEQTPVPVLPMLSGFAGQPVSEQDLVAFVEQAPPNDPGMIQLRIALAKWDASNDLELMGADGQETGSGTIVRRIAVIKSLGLSDDAEVFLREKVPVHVEGTVVISKEFEPWYEGVRH